MKKTEKVKGGKKISLTLKLMPLEALRGMEESREGYWGGGTMLIEVPGGFLSVTFDEKKGLVVMELLFPEEAVSGAMGDARKLIQDTDRRHRQRERNPFHPSNLAHLQGCNPDER
ncbi:MAG: hypothetical protein QMD77_04425 [Patescibacteria group bacterium]|nr:hypothetical protein [Patescibacteria group bacterium]